MAKYFRFPFAVTGQKTAIPETTQANGAVSYQEGYGSDYSEDPTSTPGARNIERVMFNQALFDITSTLQLYYQTAVPPYITAEENGGTAFAYQENARVFFNGRIYESTIANNTNLPTVSAAWAPVDLTGLDARFAPSNITDSLGTAARLNTGTATGQIPLIGTPGTTSAGSNSSVVIRAGSNANGSYMVYSHNVIMQWGRIILDAGPTITVNFPIPFSNTNWNIVGGQMIGIDASANIAIVGATTVSSVQVNVASSGTYFFIVLGT